MKKHIFILAGLFFALFLFTSCQISGKNGEVDSRKVVISYELNSRVASLTDKKQVTELEKLFSDAKFMNSNQKIKQPLLSVVLESGTYQIDRNDVLQLQDGTFKRADGITFKNIYAIYEKQLKK